MAFVNRFIVYRLIEMSFVVAFRTWFLEVHWIGNDLHMHRCFRLKGIQSIRIYIVHEYTTILPAGWQSGNGPAMAIIAIIIALPSIRVRAGAKTNVEYRRITHTQQLKTEQKIKGRIVGMQSVHSIQPPHRENHQQTKSKIGKKI